MKYTRFLGLVCESEGINVSDRLRDLVHEVVQKDKGHNVFKILMAFELVKHTSIPDELNKRDL